MLIFVGGSKITTSGGNETAVKAAEEARQAEEAHQKEIQDLRKQVEKEMRAKEDKFQHKLAQEKVARQRLLAAFFLLLPSQPPTCLNYAGNDNTTMKTDARRLTRLYLSRALAAWVAPLDSAFTELQLGGVLFSRRMCEGGGRRGLHHLALEISELWELSRVP
ncbi:hypothetical protein Cgig2_027174 [Carnegiea gigantea]|uniref:Uncharacterized protein n=1 Tax=Carnegiea gigantea TaxID=171969 RepID=A0A9Q1QNW6_9CARY|nr:hypothetical protein Cgig2_027174 [Carnegiea gigantea]